MKEEVPLACRTLAVVDAYDAMTNDRAYRSVRSGEAAICELEKNARTQFASEILSIFIELLQYENYTDCCKEPE